MIRFLIRVWRAGREAMRQQDALREASMRSRVGRRPFVTVGAEDLATGSIREIEAGLREFSRRYVHGEHAMHQATKHILQFFKSGHLPENLKAIAEPCEILAGVMTTALPSNPETTAGLRKLLEAKDCFVRAQLAGEPSADATTKM